MNNVFRSLLESPDTVGVGSNVFVGSANLIVNAVPLEYDTKVPVGSLATKSNIEGPG